MKNEIIRKIFKVSIQELALAGLFIALWTVSAAYIKIDFGPMKAGIYLAFAILTGLIFKPFVAIVIALISDNLQLLLSGNVWSWLFALLPIIIIISTFLVKFIFKIKNQKNWFIFSSLTWIITLSSVLIILLINRDFSHSDEGKVLDFSAVVTKVLVWTCFGVFAAIFFSLQLTFYILNKKEKNTKKLKKLINIAIIVTFVYIIASLVVGPIAAIVWLNQIGGVQHNHPNSDYYWKLYNPFVLIRIIKLPISLPIHIFIVFGVYKTYEVIKVSTHQKW